MNILCIFQNSERVQESYNASNILQTFIDNGGEIEQQVNLQGRVSLDFLGTFVLVQVERDTDPTLIEEIVVADDWECPNGTDGVYVPGT